MGSQVEENPLLEDELEKQENDAKLYTRDGSVDLHGNPAIKKLTGNWRACPFILGNECCERLAYYGIAKNLVRYLTSKLHEGNVSAARNVSTWAGTCYLSPLIGAILADAYWGRYWTIAIFSTIYMFGMGTVALSASIPALKPAECVDSVCPPATLAQYGVFFVGLYLMALGTGGIKPCVSSFGADQFDDTDPTERVKKGAFFNWFYFTINIGALVASTVLVYIQDNAGWAIGFLVPTLFMGAAIGSFFLGTRLYRFQPPGRSPITRICQVLVVSFRNRNVSVPKDTSLLFETSGNGKLDHTDEFKCLDKACVAKHGDVSSPWKLCTVTQVEEVKIIARIFPIWASGILYFSVYAQTSTMFIEQAMMMDTKLGSFTIPPASLSTADVISVICWVPVYDKLIVPLARRFTGRERGFSDLQRMGIGLIVSVSAMVAAALVEIRRLRIAEEMGLTEKNVAVPMSVLWLIPQYTLVGASEVFTSIGQLQFFYDQSPDSMRSLCSALALVTTALGNYLSSFVLTVVTYLTTRESNVGWIPDNLNEGHLDYFYWLLALFGVANFGFYVFCSSRYKYKRAH